MTKLSRVSFFLFVTIFNYLWLRIVLFPYFYNEYGSMGVYFIAVLAVCVLFIFLLIPKRILNREYDEAFKKSFFKYFYMIILLLENILGLCFCVYLLSTFFIPKSNFYIVLGIMAVTIVFMSYYKPKDLMEISTLFSIVGYGLLILTLFFYPNLDYSLLLPIKPVSYWALPFFVLMLLGNNFSILIHKKNIQFSKISFSLAIFFSLFMFGIEYFILICNAGDVFFKDLNWVGFLSLSIEPISKYFGNFEFAYIFYIILCCLFKFSFNTSIIRNNLTLNSKFLNVTFILLLCILASVCYLCIPMSNYFFKVVAIILLCGFLLIFWFIKECYHARKIKE